MVNIRRSFFEQTWNIGFLESPLEDVVGNKPFKISWLKHNYRDRWFADPFILSVDSKTIKVLVEEFYWPIGHGRIAMLVVNKDDYSLIDNITLIQEKTHLSFPYIIREDDKVLIMPESGDSNELKIYRLDIESNTCQFQKLISKGYFADSVQVCLDGKTYIVATTHPDPNGASLNVYELFGTELKLNKTITFEQKIARNAGDWFRVGDQLYRPAQDCNNGYGSAMFIQRVDISGDQWAFNNIRRIVPTSTKYNLGIHTLNTYDGISVVDGFGYKHWFARMYAKIR